MLRIYEQPLNEKIRSYLRIEAVASQVKEFEDFEHTGAVLAYFRALFELGDLLERGDLRSDVLKDLERHQTNLAQWRDLPNIDLNQLDALDSQFSGLAGQLHKLTRPTQHFKSDKFLSALRQRLTIPGGCGSFDLPQFHYWQGKPLESRQLQSKAWLTPLTPLLKSVALLLTMVRETARWQNQLAMGGNLQGATEQPLELLRIELKQDYGVYPVISAHRNRYTIHLINDETGKTDPRNLPLRLGLSIEQK